MASCIDPKIVRNIGGSNNYDPPTPGVSNASAGAQAQRMANAQEAASTRKLIDTIKTEMGSIGNRNDPLSPHSEAELSKAAFFVARRDNQFSDAAAKREAAKRDAVRLMSNTNVGAVTWFSSLANKISSALEDTMADVKAFALKYAAFTQDDVHLTAADNPLVQAVDSIRPVYDGINKTFDESFKSNVLSEAQRLSKLTGFDALDIAAVGGTIRTLLHEKEVNMYLATEYWPQKAEEALAKAERLRTQAGREAALNEARAYANDALNLLRSLDLDDVDASVRGAGHTNRQADALIQEHLDTLGLTMEDMLPLIKGYGAFNETIKDVRMRYGDLTPEEEALWKQFAWYTPLKTYNETLRGAITDSRAYDPSNYHRRNGGPMGEEHVSALNGLLSYANKAARAISMQRVTDAVYGYIRNAERNGRSHPFLVKDYDALMGFINGKNPDLRSYALGLIDGAQGGGGLIAHVKQPDGSTKRLFMTFSRSWEDSELGVTGAQLNASLMNAAKEKDFFNTASRITSGYGQLFTRFRAAFAPINSVKDVSERGFHMATRNYRREDGTYIEGYKLLPQYIANTTRAAEVMFDVLTGNLDADSANGALWREYREGGLHQRYTPGMQTNRMSLTDRLLDMQEKKGSITERELNKPVYAELKSAFEAAGVASQTALKIIDGYNDYFNNIASLSHFITMREAKVTKDAAVSGALELMNLYHSGTMTPFLRMLYPFVKPTIQSGVAMARSFGLAPDGAGRFRPNVAGIASMAALMLAYSALQTPLRQALGKDENGDWRYDALPLSSLQSFIPIGGWDDKGSYAKLYNGFGPQQVAITAVAGWDRVQRGLMAPQAFLSELAFSIGKNITPGNFPTFSMREHPAEWFMQAFSPTILQPLVSAASNRDFFGGPIENPTVEGNWKAESSQGRLSTERVYHQMAKIAREKLGIDNTPEQYKAFVNSVRGSMLGFIASWIEHDDLRTRSVDKSLRQEIGPFWETVGLNSFVGRVNNIERSSYYASLDKFKKRVKLDGVELTGAKAGASKEERRAYRMSKLRQAGWNESDIRDAITIFEAEQELRKLSKDFKEQIYTRFMNADKREDLDQEFESFAIAQQRIYSNAVRDLNWLQRARRRP